MYTMPGVPVRAVLQLSHGMCEYVQRSRPMAQWSAQRGIALAGNDHLCLLYTSNLSYCNRLFKRRYGMTPREYRSK